MIFSVIKTILDVIIATINFIKYCLLTVLLCFGIGFYLYFTKNPFLMNHLKKMKQDGSLKEAKEYSIKILKKVHRDKL